MPEEPKSIGEIAKGATIPLTPELTGALAEHVLNATKFETGDVAKVISNYVKEIRKKALDMDVGASGSVRGLDVDRRHRAWEHDGMDESAFGLELRLDVGDLEERTVERCVGEALGARGRRPFATTTHIAASRTSNFARTTSPR